MRVLTFAGLPLVLSLAAGCDSCEKKPETIVDAGSPATTAKDAGALGDAETGGPVGVADAGMKHDMGNCPTALPGVEVDIKDIPGGVEVSVTGKSESVTNEIRERMKKIAEADKTDAGTTAKHDHSGAGGGTTGRCTIIMRNTKLVTAEIPNGAKVSVSPKDPSELDWLRRETKDRDREWKRAGGGRGDTSAGAQRMAHCPSAVEGAKTTVKDVKEGVVITVTGPADKVAEIRSRAKHTADVSKKTEPPNAQHTGGGTGGGGLGRCPIVVEGDTAVVVKDVDGGVEVEVKTTKDVAALQKETKARAANFMK